MYDYIFVNKHYEVLGRESTTKYETEYGGHFLARATSVAHADDLAEWFGGNELKYGIRFSEELDLEE
jgi:hypothetical protein